MEVSKPKYSSAVKFVAKTKQNLQNKIYETLVNCHNSEFFNAEQDATK